jgi:tetratricopeptide (TPR) repeat protein
MTLQSRVAAEVADQLAVKLPPDRLRLPPSRNLEAYDLWMKGVLAWQNIGSAVGAPPEEIRRVEAMFSRALELDPEYAAVHADRARVGLYKFAGGYDTSEANIASVRADLAEARRLAGNAPHVLVREATLAALIDRDVSKALALIDEAESTGPLTADFLMSKANFLRSAGRVDESLSTHARAAKLDPGNPAIVRFWLANLFTARRPGEALQVAAEFDRRFPGRIDRGEPLFAFTGSTARWRSELDLLRETAPGATLSIEYDLLRYEGRIDELGDLLERAGESTFRQHSAYGQIVGLPPKPVAELRGWYRLLTKREVAAGKEGAALLAFVTVVAPTQSNGWWLHLLTAEGALFSGDKVRAAAQARAALELANRIPDISVLMYAKVTAARVLAWSGAESEAIGLLEGLSGQAFSMGPAAITRDALFARRLKQQPRYVVLEQRLEAEIDRNQTLLSIRQPADSASR